MNRGNLPAMALALVALFAALAGGAIAAKKDRKINGATIRVKSIPGNRITPGSIPANRLRAGVLAPAAAGEPPASVAHADTADTAGHAASAATVTAKCGGGTQRFAGACWQSTAHAVATAPAAAAACASQGGELPEVLQLVAFAAAPGVSLAAAGEWSGTIATFAGAGTFTVATVDEAGTVDADVSSASHAYRCVVPLVGA